jgi:hypothetical protein
MSAAQLLGYDPAIESVHPEERIKVSEILLMYFLLMLSGNPFFVLHYDLLVVVSVVVPLYYIFTNSYKKVTPSLYLHSCSATR